MWRTIILPFHIDNHEYTRLLVSTCILWKNAVQKVLDTVKQIENPENEIKLSQNKFKTKYYKVAYSEIPNKYYAEPATELVHNIGRSLLGLKQYFKKKFNIELNVSICDIELKDWKMFETRGDKCNGGNPYVKLLDNNMVRVKVFNLDRSSQWIEFQYSEPRSRRLRELVEKVRELACRKEVAYKARIYLRHVSIMKGIVDGEVQIAIPEELYYSTYYKAYNNDYEPDYVIGFDINFDYIVGILVDKEGKIVEKPFELDLSTYVTQGRYWKDSHTILSKWLHILLISLVQKYGKIAVAVEDPEVLGYLKTLNIVRGVRYSSIINYKVMRFSSSFTETIIETAKKHNIKTIHVDPKGTTHSKEHDEIMRKYRFNRHQASAYIIAIRGLEKLTKHDKR